MPDNPWFEAFYERNYRLVYRLCFTYMKNPSEAEDCTEDVFVKVLTGDLSFHDETHEKKWLTVTAINLCITAAIPSRTAFTSGNICAARTSMPRS